MSTINKASYKFLNDLAKNNTKEWFADNKPRYQIALDNMKAFQSAVDTEMNKHDLIEKSKLFRIYRDVRFSKDKTPYKRSFSGSYSRSTYALRGGYYWHVEPKGTKIAAGFFNPDPKDLKLIRSHLSAEPGPLRKIMKAKKFKETWGAFEGNQVKTCPKGFSKEDPALDLIKFKQFIFVKTFSDKEVMDPKFHKMISQTFKSIRPFFDYMSEILTHDLNGVSLLAESK